MGLLSGNKLIVGYELGNEYCQISYAFSADGAVETLSQVAGEEIYNIPTVLCKRFGVNQWYYGREAVRQAEEGQGILVENIWNLALDGELIVIDGESYDPISLMALFFKRSMGLLSQVGTPEKLTAMMITCASLNRRILEVLYRMVDGIHLKRDRVSFQSYMESYYNYMLRQPEELWVYMSILFEYRENMLKVYRLECNRHTTPIVVFIEPKEQRTFMEKIQSFRADGGEAADGEKDKALDKAFLELAQVVCSDSRIRSVFLIGDGFGGDWMKDSLRYLCKGRRVFQGNNLFSKGACHSVQEKMEVSDMGKTHVFLGTDKLKANVGMEVLRRGESSYCALLDAGVNWYEAEQDVELYLQDGNEILLVVTPLIGKQVKTIRVVLENFPASIARLRLHLYLEEEKRLAVEVEDLGFGEFRLPSGRMWKEEVEIY
ncbi:MAG: hypothetical protein HFH82_10325 [Lachnospiraceae bacterium]|nr:hypothetical protein [Lachnospiraceae bacterium]